MAKWYKKVISSDQDDFTELFNALEYFQEEIEEAENEVKIQGNFEKESSNLSGITQYRFNQYQEVEAILKYLEILFEREKGKSFKKYLEHYNRTLTSRDAEKYSNSDDKVVELSLLINHVSFIRNQYLGIMKGLETKHWQLSNLIKMKIAGMEDYDIDPSNT